MRKKQKKTTRTSLDVFRKVVQPPEIKEIHNDPSFAAKMQGEAEATLGFGISVTLRVVLWGIAGVDMTIFPAYFRGSVVAETPEKPEVAREHFTPLFPVIFRTLEIGLVSLGRIEPYIWGYANNEPGEKLSEPAEMEGDFVGILKLPEIAGSFDGPVYDTNFCDGSGYPITIKRDKSIPDNWYENIIAGWEGMVDGPHKWIQIDDWGSYEADPASDLTSLSKMPEWKLSSVGWNKDTLRFEVMDTSQQFEYWLLSTYLGIFPFVLKLSYQPSMPQPKSTNGFEFRCCDDFDCIKYDGAANRGSCGYFLKSTDQDQGGFIGDCFPSCDYCTVDTNVFCPGGVDCPDNGCPQGMRCYNTYCSNPDDGIDQAGVCAFEPPQTVVA